MKKRRALKSRRVWDPAIFRKSGINCTYAESVKVIETMHAHFIKFVEEKHRPVCISRNIGYLTLEKFKPKNKIYMLTPGEKGRRLLVNHHSQGYIFRYMFKPSKRVYMRAYKLFPARLINRAIKDKILRRELR